MRRPARRRRRGRGGLRAYSAGGRDVLDGYGADEMCHSRPRPDADPVAEPRAGGRYEFDGRAHQLALTEPERATRSTASCAGRRGRSSDASRDRVVLEHVLHPQPGYPFSLALRLEYALGDAGLRVSADATNIGAEPCPYGSGAHPYLTVGTAAIDTVDPARARPDRAALRRARHPDRLGAGRGHAARLPPAAADRLDAARPRVHRPRSRR